MEIKSLLHDNGHIIKNLDNYKKTSPSTDQNQDSKVLITVT